MQYYKGKPFIYEDWGITTTSTRHSVQVGRDLRIWWHSRKVVSMTDSYKILNGSTPLERWLNEIRVNRYAKKHGWGSRKESYYWHVCIPCGHVDTVALYKPLKWGSLKEYIEHIKYAFGTPSDVGDCRYVYVRGGFLTKFIHTANFGLSYRDEPNWGGN